MTSRMNFGAGWKNAHQFGGEELAHDLLNALKSMYGKHSIFHSISEELIASWVPFDNGRDYFFLNCINRIVERVNVCTTRAIDIDALWGVPLSIDYNVEIATLNALTPQRTEAIDKLKHIEEKIDRAREDHADLQADTTAAALNTSRAANGIEFLVSDRKRKLAANKQRGKDNQARGNTEEMERAARDMKTALNRVHDRMKKGATNLLAECRSVCKRFKPLTNRKNELGKYAECVPLTGASGKAIKPETLAKNYRNRFGTKKARKARSKRRIN